MIKIMAFVACRLLALNVAINYGLAALYTIAGALIAGAWRGAAAGLVLLILAFAISLGLWGGAAKIAAWLTRSLPENNGSASWRATDWQTLAVVGVGVLFALTGLNLLWTVLQTRLTHGANSFSPVFLLAHVLFYILIGCTLIASARSLVSGLRRLRKWSAEPIVDEDGR